MLLYVVCCAVTSGEKLDISLGLLHNTTQKKTLKLISNFSPLVTAQHTTYSNIRLVLLKMGKIMPETC